MDGRITTEYDLQSLTTIAAGFLPEGLKLTGKRKEVINFNTQYPEADPEKLLSNLSTSASFGFDSAEYMGLNVSPTEVKLQIEKGMLIIPQFSSTANNGQINFAANMDLNQQPMTLKTPTELAVIKDVEINDRMARQLLMYINPIFAGATNVKGVANFQCSKLSIPLSAKDKNAIDIEGIIAIDKVRLEASNLIGQLATLLGARRTGLDIVIHPTNFTVKNGLVNYDNMQMDIDGKPINFNGHITLDGRMNMTVTGPWAAKLGGQSRRISLPLTGRVNAPEIDTKKLLEQEGRKILEEQLQKGLEDLFK